MIIVDDVHTLAGSPAEAALERLITLLPAGVAMLLAARQAPGFNVSRLRANGLIAELGPDDLRFKYMRLGMRNHAYPAKNARKWGRW